MSDSRTTRSLSIDGGGMRGMIPNIFMKLFMQHWGKNPNNIAGEFDVISGSSIGGILSLAYATGKSPADVEGFFNDDGPWIFTTNSSTPSQRAGNFLKIGTITTGTPATFYASNTNGIGTKRLKSKLDSEFGTLTMQDLQTNVLITSFEKNDVNPDFAASTNVPVYFSNSNIIPVLTGQNHQIVDVAMATSAAPLYFPAWPIGDDKYIDGGVVQNNTCNINLALAKALKPTGKRHCVLSLGTGLGDVGFAPDNTNQLALLELQSLNADPEAFAEQWQLTQSQISELQSLGVNLALLDGAKLIMYLIGAMTAGPQEIADKELEIVAKYTLDNTYRYRMQYYLDPTKDTELDNSSPDIRAYYEESVTEYFNNDIANISAFIARLDA